MKPLNDIFKGVFAISATPFDSEGLLDLESAQTLVDFYVNCGVRGITILGVMGEAQKLSAEEALNFTQCILRRVAGRIPVFVGITNSDRSAMKNLSDYAMALGAAGVMVAPQPGLVGDDAVYNYLNDVFELLGSDVPVCIQDFPPANGVKMSLNVVTRLINERLQFVIFKHEDCPGLAKLTKLRGMMSDEKCRRVSILVGNSGLYLPLELHRGADGAMTGFSFPDILVQVHERFVEGDVVGAEDLFDQYLPLIRYDQQPNFGLGIRKEVLRRRGAIVSAHVRSPGPIVGQEELNELDHLLARIEVQAKSEP